MKTVIFAGGKGSRLMEETTAIPKPMVPIAGKPILWHIMKRYSMFGFNDFIICCGYKGDIIKQYFANYFYQHSDITYDFSGPDIKIEVHNQRAEPWKVTLVDTGLETQTAGRLAKIRNHLGEDDFHLTYGDGLSDLNFHDLTNFHKASNKLATVTATIPQGRFGRLTLDGNLVSEFEEKPAGDGHWINGGFFVLSTKIFSHIPEDNEDVPWEKAPLESLTAAGELSAYKHKGFWQPMDTLRDKIHLENLAAGESIPWLRR